MTDRIEQIENYLDITNKQKLELIIKSKNFLKQPLQLGFFVPCNFDGNVLEEPNHLDYKIKNEYGELIFMSELFKNRYSNDYGKYQEAKERCIFNGFEFSHDNDYNSVIKQNTNSGIKVEIQFRKYENDVRIIINSDYIHDCGCIERLIGLDTKPVLTESAKKQLSL